MSEYESLADYLFLHRAPNLPANALAHVLDCLIWCLDDNGAELPKSLTAWLHSDDFERVEIALTMEEVFPCNTRAEMVQLFDVIVVKWPSLLPLCEEWLRKWDQQFSPNL